MVFSYDFSKNFRKDIDALRKNNPSYFKKTKLLIKKIIEDPYSSPYETIQGQKDAIRYRMGEYRLVLDIKKKEKYLNFRYVKKRGTIYHKL